MSLYKPLCVVFGVSENHNELFLEIIIHEAHDLFISLRLIEMFISLSQRRSHKARLREMRAR